MTKPWLSDRFGNRETEARDTGIAEHRRDRGSLPVAEHLKFLSEISCLVSSVPVSELPQVLGRILEKVRETIGLIQGAISLQDFISDRLYSIEESGAPTSQQLEMQPLSSLDFLSPAPPCPQGSVIAQGNDSSTVLNFPLAVGSQQLGALHIVSCGGKITLNREQEGVLTSFASLAALAIDRCRNEVDRFRLEEWLGALSSISAASRAPSTTQDVEGLLQEIADNALKISRADCVTLYEYFEELDDVRIPPALAGSFNHADILRGRSLSVEHKKSVIFRILERKKPFFARRVETWVEEELLGAEAVSDERSFFCREKIVSSAGIPLVLKNQRVGVLFINYRQERSFSPEFREHLQLFANQAALAIGNARFFFRSDRYSRNLGVLNQIGRELGSAVSRDIEQIGKLIHDLTQRIILTKNFFLCLYDDKLESFDLPYIVDEYDNREALAPRLHEGLTGYVCRNALPLLATPERKRALFEAGEAQLVGRSAEVWLGSPLVVRDRVIGAIVIQDYENEAAFGEEHLQLFTAIASQAAIAIDNSRLLQDTKLRSEELLALLNLSQVFGTGKLTSTQLLSSILDDVCRLAHGDGGLLLLTDPRDKALLKITAASNSLARYRNRLVPSGEGVSGKVVETKKPFIGNDYAVWPHRSTVFDPPPEHVCAVPLVWNDEVIGVLTLSSDRKERRFSHREIEILQRFAGPAAVAIQNSRDSSFRQALIHAGPYAIVAVNQEGRITEFNEEAARLFKYRKEEVGGELVTELYAGTREEAQKLKDDLFAKGKIEEGEVFGYSRTGEKIPLSLTAVLLKEENGDVIGCVGVVEDLRIQSLRGRTYLLVDALREISAGENLETITRRVVGSAVGLLYADAGCLFLRENDSFEIKFSLGHDEDLLRALREGLARDRMNQLAAEDPRQITFLEKAAIGDFTLFPDARSCVLVPIRTDTKLLGFLLIESHETNHFSADQKLLEVLASQAAVSVNRVQLLEYRDRMQKGLLVSANAIAVGQIATTFLHEAKNSLNGISLTIQSVQEDIEREPDLKSKKDYMDRLAVIQSEVARFDALSRGLQRFTQHGFQPQKKEIYVNEIVTQTLILLGSAIRGKKLKLETKLDNSLDRPASGKGQGNPILADEDQLQQVLMNLILNAIAASADRRPLLVETRNLADQLEIRVTDHGTGIQSEARGNLFKLFFTTKKDGVGLGLFLSRMLVEDNHGGSIEIVNSIPGKGSTFAIRLPKD